MLHTPISAPGRDLKVKRIKSASSLCAGVAHRRGGSYIQMSSIKLYAEFLPNISQVVLAVTLKSCQNDGTRIELSSDFKWVTLKHEDEQSVIELPCRVSAMIIPEMPKYRTTDISFRWPTASGTGSAQAVESSLSRSVPWSATFLTNATCLGCRRCKTIIVSETIRAWKDLPSKNWSDMMEFWHCHKADCTSNSSDTITRSAAFEGIKSTPEIGLVDTAAFVIFQGDCNNLVVSTSSSLLVTVSRGSMLHHSQKGNKKEACLRFWR